MTFSAVVIVVGLVAWATVFGTIGGVLWRNRGGNASTGFWIGAIFGVFGVAFTALATPYRASAVSAASEIRVPLAYEPPPPMTPWRERRIGAAGWAAVGVCVVVVGALMLTLR